MAKEEKTWAEQQAEKIKKAEQEKKK